MADERGACCGMVAQADIAKGAPARGTAGVVQAVSQPSETASRVAGGRTA